MGREIEAIPPAALAAGLVSRAAGRHPGADGPRIIAIDGWSGSGKTRLAELVAPALGAPCVHLDDFVPGWEGLDASVDLLVEWVLEPLTDGRPASWRRWDWAAGRWEGKWQTLAPAELVLVEGCGAGAARARPWLSAMIWIDADAEQRSRRLRARSDWAGYEPWAAVWADQERALRVDDDPVSAADAVVRTERDDDGTLGVTWRR